MKNEGTRLNNFVKLVMIAVAISALGLSACAKRSESDLTAAGDETNGSNSANGGNIDSGSIDGSGRGGKSGSGSAAGLGTIYFDYDSSKLSNETKQALKAAASSLKSKKSMTINIEGHADERGSNEYNLALGQRRANAVRDYLTALGLGKISLKTISYGEERPAVNGTDESAYAKNRRVEFETR